MSKWRFYFRNDSLHLEGSQEVEYPDKTKAAEIFSDALAWQDNITNTGHLSVTNLSTGETYIHIGRGKWSKSK